MLDVINKSATRAARRPPRDTSWEDTFDNCTEAHNELHWPRGYSHFQLLIGRSPLGLPLEDEEELGEVSASLTTDGRRRLHIHESGTSHTWGLLVNGVVSGHHYELIHIAERRGVGSSRTEHFWDQREFHCKREERAHVEGVSTKQQLGLWMVIS